MIKASDILQNIISQKEKDFNNQFTKDNFTNKEKQLFNDGYFGFFQIDINKGFYDLTASFQIDEQFSKDNLFNLLKNLEMIEQIQKKNFNLKELNSIINYKTKELETLKDEYTKRMINE